MKYRFTNLLSVLVVFFLIAIPVSSEIKDGNAYKINSCFTGKKALYIANSSLDNNEFIIAWTETNVPAQRWIAQDAGDNTFHLVNAYTEIAIAGFSHRPKANDKLIQRVNDLDYGKWEFIPVNNPKYPDAYFIRFSHQSMSGTDLFVELPANKDGTQIILNEKYTTADSIRQMWTVTAEEILPNRVTNALRDSVMQGWKRKYFNMVKTSTGFWGEAEMMETILDAYETTGKEEYKVMFEQVYEHFVSYPAGWYQPGNGQDWGWNEFNDDIAWAVLASVRAHLMLGNHPNSSINYLSIAKTNFDKMYSRSKTPSGMLRWKQSPEGNLGVNSCINGPAEIAACYLAIATGNDTYNEKARDLYDLQRKHLYEVGSGKVFDSGSWEGGSFKVTNHWVSTYNQGTFLGAAVMLYNRYGDTKYLNDAHKIVELTRKDLCNTRGVVKVCGSGDDLQGFKGILMRYIRRYIVDLAQPDKVEWMQVNALHAYNNRNSDGVIWTAWWEKTSENYIHSDGYNFANRAFGASTAVSAAFNAPTSPDLIIKDAFQTIEAEHFDYLKGILVEENEENILLGNITNGYYTGYNNVDFGQDLVKGIQIRVQSSRQAGRTIEVRKGAPTGELLGVAEIPAGNGFVDATADIASVSGMQNIYLVYQGVNFMVDNFYFTKGTDGINDVNNPMLLSIYPNPATTHLKVDSPYAGQLSVYDLSGKEIESINKISESISIDVSRYNEGMYIIQMKTSNGIFNAKFIKEGSTN